MGQLFKIPPFAGVVLGIFCYELGTTFLYLYKPYVIPTLMRVTGLFLILYFALHSSYKPFSGKVAFYYKILVLWIVLVVLRGVFIGNLRPDSTSFSDGLRFAFIGEFGEITYLAPLLALMAVRLESLYYLRKFAIVFSVLFLLLAIANREQLFLGMVAQGMTDLVGFDGEEISVRNLIRAASPGFGLIILMLFCYNYLKGKAKILLPASIILSFIGYAIGGGRGTTAFSLLYLILFFYIVLKYPVNGVEKLKSKRGKKMFRFILFTLIIFAGAWGLNFLYEQTHIFDALIQHAFGGPDIDSGTWNDNRGDMTSDFFTDFNSDFLSWIWGRGANGSFHTSYKTSGGQRVYMEWGYLYLILKGGIIYLFLYVYCLLHGAYVGYFRSKNAFSKALSIMCLILILNLVSTGAEPQYSMLYILSWMCFGLVERNEVRSLSDHEIYNYFNIKHYSKKR